MRKINKACNLSTVYKAWEANLENNQSPHPKYNSSNGKYYWDIVMQLFKCQKGLCAYTEQELCDESLFLDNLWENGRYRNPPMQNNRFGELEHFDESLKAKKGDEQGRKDWLWQNLFMVHSDINKRKGTQEVDEILKPDTLGYNPFLLLEYDPDTHFFIPHRNLSSEISERVKKMILTLRINNVSAIRGKFLLKHFVYARTRPLPLGQITPEQYPTSFEMCVRLLKEGKISLKDLVD